jgi:hypothetical protein
LEALQTGVGLAQLPQTMVPPQPFAMTPQVPTGQFAIGVQHAFWKQTSPLAQHVPAQQRLLAQELLQHPLQRPSQQFGVLPPQPVSSQQPWQTPLQLSALSAGQAHAPSWQVDPPAQLPARGAPHGLPMAMETGFFFPPRFFFFLPLPRPLASALTSPPPATGDLLLSPAPSVASS